MVFAIPKLIPVCFVYVFYLPGGLTERFVEPFAAYWRASPQIHNPTRGRHRISQSKPSFFNFFWSFYLSNNFGQLIWSSISTVILECIYNSTLGSVDCSTILKTQRVVLYKNCSLCLQKYKPGVFPAKNCMAWRAAKLWASHSTSDWKVRDSSRMERKKRSNGLGRLVTDTVSPVSKITFPSRILQRKLISAYWNGTCCNVEQPKLGRVSGLWVQGHHWDEDH